MVCCVSQHGRVDDIALGKPPKTLWFFAMLESLFFQVDEFRQLLFVFDSFRSAAFVSLMLRMTQQLWGLNTGRLADERSSR